MQWRGKVETALPVWTCRAVPLASFPRSEFQYHHFHEPRPMRLDPNRVALFSATEPPGAESLRTRLEQRGLAVDEINPPMVLGWNIVTLAGGPGEGGAFIPNDTGFPNRGGLHNTGQFSGLSVRIALFLMVIVAARVFRNLRSSGTSARQSEVQAIAQDVGGIGVGNYFRVKP